ncbi:uncharacterized protein [Physcomitrium patens]|uniref:Uncharacterized protein n=1 Tax=Physcomitrium patens TaxID=3218 RepID=A0A2K1INH2_PHYPA|nr:uncharacterized protein LOC112274865 [Physcomitrium patens]PNR30817.1 hypothetical protein PHYPA_027133 [Physcomitrium patens]|eukprot:XP_024360457.1 uncharacterized protein LOC112274865 [Physcomitrella patens]
MGKKKGGQGGGGGGGYGSNKNPPNQPGLLLHAKPVSLREQLGRGGGAAAAASAQTQNPSALPSTLRAEHLLRLATWASANVPSLGALLGARLGHLSEAAAALLPDSPHSICERCESIMQVGVNCSVRITKNKRKRKSRNADNVCNYVTYFCHYCKHGNLKPGTSKNHLKTKISQAAARSNLKVLGLSKPVERIPNKKL